MTLFRGGYELHKRCVRYFTSCILYDKVGRRWRKLFRNHSERKLLHNHNFTIIAQNCIGSIWYHDLGEQFCSPTINMKFEPDSFIKFLSNIHHYLNQQFTFIESDKPYPVGYLGNDVLIEFVHYHSAEEVVSKWQQRKQRINRDNLCVIACDKDMSPKAIQLYGSLHQFKNRILFYTGDKPLPDECGVTQIQQPFFADGADARLLNFCSITGLRFYNKIINYVKYLNNISE